jgi:hypothetical protein
MNTWNSINSQKSKRDNDKIENDEKAIGILNDVNIPNDVEKEGILCATFVQRTALGSSSRSSLH